jgi:ABC-type transport system substrate-binding protein
MGRATKRVSRRAVLKEYGAAAGLLAAIGVSPAAVAAQETSDAAEGEPKPGGALIVAIPQSVQVLNPVDRAAGGPLSFVMQQVFEGPLRSAADPAGAGRRR